MSFRNVLFAVTCVAALALGLSRCGKKTTEATTAVSSSLPSSISTSANN